MSKGEVAEAEEQRMDRYDELMRLQGRRPFERPKKEEKEEKEEQEEKEDTKQE